MKRSDVGVRVFATLSFCALAKVLFGTEDRVYAQVSERHRILGVSWL